VPVSSGAVSDSAATATPVPIKDTHVNAVQMLRFIADLPKEYLSIFDHRRYRLNGR